MNLLSIFRFHMHSPLLPKFHHLIFMRKLLFNYSRIFITGFFVRAKNVPRHSLAFVHQAQAKKMSPGHSLALCFRLRAKNVPGHSSFVFSAQAKNIPGCFTPKQLIQRFIETFANRYA